MISFRNKLKPVYRACFGTLTVFFIFLAAVSCFYPVVRAQAVDVGSSGIGEMLFGNFNNSLDFGGFKDFLDAAGGVGGVGGAHLTKEEMYAIKETLIKAQFSDVGFIETLRSSSLTGQAAADALIKYANTNPEFAQYIYGNGSKNINNYAKTVAGKADLKSLQTQTANGVSGGVALTQNSNGSLTKKSADDLAAKYTSKDDYANALKSLNNGYTYTAGQIFYNGVYDTVATEAANSIGKPSISSDDSPACDSVLLDGKNPNAADWNSEGTPSSSGSGSGSGSGGGSGSGSGTAVSSTCTSYTYSSWGACSNGNQARTIASQTPSGCTDTSSATLKQTCVAVKPVVTNTTNAAQSVADVVLSVSTLRTVACQYSLTSSFSYGGGTTFGTTGNYIHNTALSGMANGSHTYYVICQDDLTGGMSDTVTVAFTVTLPTGVAPTVNNITPPTQTTASSNLSVTTDPGAVCRYQKDNATFAFDSGIAMAATNNNHSHEASIASLGNGTYTFYVICKDISTGVASAAKQVVTIINYLPNDTNAPELKNMTLGYQTTSSPVISVTTNFDSTCQYSAAIFSYGSGTQFATDGSVDHSTQLSGIGNGQHGYYVICKRTSNNAVSAAGYQIIFTVKTGNDTGTCVTLSSNDRQNNSDRASSGDTSSNTVYPWQSVETGTREKFTKVDWYAGYQFTPEKDGKVTQLCGYFDSGVANKVSLFNGAYSEIASAQITGTGKWECADVSPAAVVADGRYYVITRANNTPIYFEYKSGLLPVDAGNIVIEAGIRQTFIQGKFKTDIVKYDYMIFGLVDVKINFGGNSTSGPKIASVGPSGTVYASSASIIAQTKDDATCSFDRDDVDYSKMKYSLPKISAGSFNQKICGLEEGDYTFYVRCQNNSDGANDASAAAQFTVEQ